MSNELVNYIAAENARTQAWIAEAPGRWAGLITEDLSHWAERGVTTVAEFELYMAQATWSDAYKDAYVFRPRIDTSSWTLADFQSDLESLSATIQQNIAEEREEAARAVAAFEARVAEVIESGAGDRATALRWLWQADNSENPWNKQDVEHWVYNQGFLFTDEGRALVEYLDGVVTYQMDLDHA